MELDQYINTAARNGFRPVLQRRDTAPHKPTNLVATANDSNPSTSPGASTGHVTGYDIYRDGSLLTTVTPVTSYYDGTVSPDTTYSYRIRARDAGGRVSSLSTAASVTTPGLLFSDGFESGNFLQWAPVSGLVMQQQEVYAGTRAVQAISSGTPTDS
jgi:hypothetical protein